MLLPRFAAAQKHAQMENAFWARALAAAKKKNSETGNRTLGICVTGRDVTNYTISERSGVSGFRSQYLVLAKHARFRLRQYPDASGKTAGTNGRSAGGSKTKKQKDIQHPRFPCSPLPKY